LTTSTSEIALGVAGACVGADGVAGPAAGLDTAGVEGAEDPPGLVVPDGGFAPVVGGVPGAGADPEGLLPVAPPVDPCGAVETGFFNPSFSRIFVKTLMVAPFIKGCISLNGKNLETL
jgi:hypothetical protein